MFGWSRQVYQFISYAIKIVLSIVFGVIGGLFFFDGFYHYSVYGAESENVSFQEFVVPIGLALVFFTISFGFLLFASVEDENSEARPPTFQAEKK